MAPFMIRNLTLNDIPSLMLLPQAEGREMGLEPELHTWMKVDPHGIFIAIDVENGEIVGCCSAIILSESHGYLGMYVVSKRHRGGGLGRILWKAAVSHLGDRNMCLSAVESMAQCYKEKAGFSIATDWTVNLYFYSSTSFSSDNYIHADFTHKLLVVEPNGPLLDLVVSYDNSVHSYDRTAIVASTVSEPGTVTVVALRNVDGHPVVVGYACMKKSLQGHWLVAPVYANDYTSAYSLVNELLDSLSQSQREEGMVAKLVSTNYDAAKLFHNLGFKRTKYHLQRLYTRKLVDIPVTRIFALQSSIFCTE